MGVTPVRAVQWGLCGRPFSDVLVLDACVLPEANLTARGLDNATPPPPPLPRTPGLPVPMSAGTWPERTPSSGAGHANPGPSKSWSAGPSWLLAAGCWLAAWSTVVC